MYSWWRYSKYIPSSPSELEEVYTSWPFREGDKVRQILFLSLSDSSSGTAPEFRACFDLSSCWTSASSTYSTSSYVDAISIPIIVTMLSRQSLSDKESARVLEDRRLFVRWQKTWTDLSSILPTFSPTTNIFQNYCGCCCLAPPCPFPSSSTQTDPIGCPKLTKSLNFGIGVQPLVLIC